MEKQIEQIEIINPNKAWVVKELRTIIDEWHNWEKEVQVIQDHPYNLNIQTEVFKDGEENMNKHNILQAKTLTFLNNNIRGHGFIKGLDGKSCDRTDLRLEHRVKHRIYELEILKECIKYAKVPESFWKKKGKELVEKISDMPVEIASKVATDWLKDPLG